MSVKFELPSGIAPDAQLITCAVVNPYATSSLANSSVYSTIYWIPPDVTTVYVQVGLRQLITPDGASSNTTSMKIAGGQPSVDRQSFVGSPTVFTGLTFPAYMLSDRVTIPVVRDSNGYMMFRWTVPSGPSFIEYTTNAGQTGYCKTIQNSQDVVAASGWSDTEQPAGQLLVSYYTTAPRLIIWDDSIMRGLSAAGECGLPNTLVRLGPNRGYAVSVVGVGFARAKRFANLDNWMLGGDLTNTVDAYVLISLGTNDLFGTVWGSVDTTADTAVNVINYLRRGALNARAAGAKAVGIATIISSASYSGPQEAERVVVNAWIRQQAGIFDWVLDMDTIIGTAAAHPTWFATGGVHLTTLGFDNIEPIFPVLT